ncbi:MAG TPA: CCA tRNA nucleotidyltransferase [Patescibacteria group bacterium]|nr:CCA tRNA nucleotidyltransferase [Patescibacteria group bacterium]
MSLAQLWRTIYRVSQEQKLPIYAVGGYVRDRLLKKKGKVKDIDFVVDGSGIVFARAFDVALKQIGSLIEFPEFDTARYVFCREHDGQKEVTLEVEFAGARKEAYQDKSRKPQVEKATLAEDLQRRDFTVNALARAVGPSGLKRTLIDPFFGQKDLQQKILRTPLDPDITFSEDPLRLLRAARFAAQLNFSLAPETLAALTRNRQRLSIVSSERIKEELFKLLATPQPSLGLQVLFSTQVLEEFLPELTALSGVEEIFGQHHKNNFVHTLKVVDNIAQRSDKVILRLAGLLHDIGKTGTKEFIPGRGWAFDMHEHLGRKLALDICRRLRLSKEETKYVTKLVRYHQQPIALMDAGVTDSAVRRLIVSLGDNLEDLLTLCRSDITTGNPEKLRQRLANYDRLEKRILAVVETDKLRAFQSPLRGEEIMELCGLAPGPTVGRIKKALEEAILEGEIPNDHDATKALLLKIKDQYLTRMGDWEEAKK